MSATTIRYRGRVINHDPMTNPENGYVEGFYFQDLDNGVVKHYIFNCPMTWEVDPSTVRIIWHDDLQQTRIMSKKLAIRGHSTRGKEVIELLEMMGGKNVRKLDGEANIFLTI